MPPGLRRPVSRSVPKLSEEVHRGWQWRTASEQVGQLRDYGGEEPLARRVGGPTRQEVADDVDLIRQADCDGLVGERALARKGAAGQPAVALAPGGEGADLGQFSFAAEQ